MGAPGLKLFYYVMCLQQLMVGMVLVLFQVELPVVGAIGSPSRSSGHWVLGSPGPHWALQQLHQIPPLSLLGYLPACLLLPLLTPHNTPTHSAINTSTEV